MKPATELGQIARRIRTRDEAQAADRRRQRELIRLLIRDGSTWDTVQAAARVSRPTIMATLKRTD